MKPKGRVTLACCLAVGVLYGCGGSNPSSPPAGNPLPLIASYALALSEPSDLAIDDTGTILWTVTNNPDSVFQLDLTGNRTKVLKYVGHDLEGITYDKSDHSLWVAEENRREVVHLDLDGNVLSRHSLNLTGEQNSGLEGICLDAAGQMFLVNEKNPGMFIRLDSNHDITTMDTLTFAGDYSGINDAGASRFWILSDQSKQLFLWSPTTGIAKQYDLHVAKAEGVAVDTVAHRVYVVSDSENRLFVFKDSP